MGATCWGKREEAGAQPSGTRPTMTGEAGFMRKLFTGWGEGDTGKGHKNRHSFVQSPLCLGPQRGLPGGGSTCSRLEVQASSVGQRNRSQWFCRVSLSPLRVLAENGQEQGWRAKEQWG